jgi:hypothetical protein
VSIKDLEIAFSVPEFSLFGYLVLAFWSISFFLCAFILSYLYRLNRREPKYRRWKFISDTFIRNAIFFEEGDRTSGAELSRIVGANIIPTPGRLEKLLPNRHFRDMIIRDLLAARENMSGAAAVNIKTIFYQLRLNERVAQMISGSSWHIRAAGIQLAGIMEMQECRSSIEKLTNHERALIRMEAQNTLLKLSGFDGLRFLNDATYPISEWQQVKILDELSRLPPENFTGIEKWLKSKNDSVVIFALKLARVYYRFELYDQVLSTLGHENPEVRRQAILSCSDLQTASTAQSLSKQYAFEDTRNKTAILKAIARVGSNEEIPFLRAILDETNLELVIDAAHALAGMGEEGIKALEAHPNAGVYPLEAIIIHIKSLKS